MNFLYFAMDAGPLRPNRTEKMQNAHTNRWIAVLALLFVAQLSWWALLIWRQSEELQQAAYQGLNAERRLAEHAWHEVADREQNPALAWQSVAARFPNIVHLPARDGGSLQINGQRLEALNTSLRMRRAMVLGEGCLFFFTAALGLWLMTRTAKQENYLRLQHSNFLHAVTHEFRSPIQALRLAVDTLRRRQDRPPPQDYLESMHRDLGRLDSLVANVLAVGRLDAQAFRATPKAIDLSAAVHRATDEYLRSLPEPSDWLRCQIEDRVVAEADPATLSPIVRNLLENARKYGEGQEASLILRREGSHAVLRVRDRGRGFSGEDAKHLFERFWRAGDERIRSSPGTGLGLYLTAELVRAQDASIRAESDGPGKGAEFLVSWPTAAAPAELTIAP